MDLTDFRHLSTSSLMLAHGPAIAGPRTSQGGLGAGQIVAHPFVTGKHGGTITGARLRTVTTDSQCMLRLAVYARLSANDRYPSALIADLGSHFCASVTTVLSFAATATSANDLWWLAFQVNSSRTWHFFSREAEAITWGTGRTNITAGLAGGLVTSFGISSCWPATFPLSATANSDDLPSFAFIYGAFP